MSAATTAITATAPAATAAITTPAATTTTAAAFPTATATAETTAAATGLRPRFIDRNGSAIHLLTVERANGRLRFLVVAHFYETEAFGAAGVTIDNNLRRLHCAMGAELLLQIAIADAIA